MENVIEVKNITKEFRLPMEKRSQLKDYFVHPFKRTKYREFRALSNISFSVKKGEFLGIIGRNGSGKSTLLKIIAGIYLQDKGKINVKGKIVPFLELGVGFNMELTAKDNIFLNGVILGLSREEVKKKYKEIIEFSELQGFEETQLKNFSSGMQVRLAFSIAIQAHGDIYILDEVLAVGDLGFQQKCFDMFRKLKSQGKTIIFVSHSMGAIEEFCDRVILLDKGNIRKEGNVLNVVKNYSEVFFSKTENTFLEKDGEFSLKILGKDGKDKNIFDFNEELSIKIIYNLKKEIISPFFEIIITREDGIIISAINSKYSNLSLGSIKGKGAISFSVNNLNLYPSEYSISLVVYSKDLNEQIVLLEKIRNFKTFLSRDNIKGILEIEGEWSSI